MKFRVPVTRDCTFTQTGEVVVEAHDRAHACEVAEELSQDDIIECLKDDPDSFHYGEDSGLYVPDPAAVVKVPAKTKTGPVIVPEDPIQRHRFTTKAGHELSVFFNRDTGLLVVDLNHKERAGGSELVRRTLDEERLLSHCAKLPKWEDA
jgi:hypothetical protein